MLSNAYLLMYSFLKKAQENKRKAFYCGIQFVTFEVSPEETALRAQQRDFITGYTLIHIATTSMGICVYYTYLRLFVMK